MAYQLYQGIITKYTSPTTCDVVQIPENYLMTNVRLPLVLSHQIKPKKGSVVLVASEDLYKSVIITTLREPIEYVNDQSNLKIKNVQGAMLEGELYFESHGNPNDKQFLQGASFHLTNAGTCKIRSSLRSEFLVIGGLKSDEDQAVILQGTNGFFQSNINPALVPALITGTQSVVRFDKLNNLQVANIKVTPGPVPLEVITSELNLDYQGNVLLRNTLAGVDNASLSFTKTGNIVLTNKLSPAGTMEFTTALGDITLKSTGGNIVANGVQINLNSGTKGAARVNDSVLINSVSDPAWITFINTLNTFFTTLMATFNSHTHAYVSPGGPSVSAPPAAPIAAVPSAPVTTTGLIVSGSATVKIGN